jgi:molybdate transport repressor ModE-like protein
VNILASLLQSTTDTQVRADDFRYLSAIARTGTRRAAVPDLGVDHTTVWRRIQALEKVLKVRLIERGSDVGRPTFITRFAASIADPQVHSGRWGEPVFGLTNSRR